MNMNDFEKCEKCGSENISVFDVCNQYIDVDCRDCEWSVKHIEVLVKAKVPISYIDVDFKVIHEEDR